MTGWLRRKADSEMKTYKGTGVITDADFKNVKWKGLTKAGIPVEITLENAINMGNIDWTFKEKDDTVAQIVMTATYSNTDAMSEDTKEPFSISIDGNISAGAGEILLGAGIFYIEDKKVALSRGGGQFTVEREFRQIAADGDRGPVKGRVVMDGSKATLTLNVLTILTSLVDLYPAIEDVTDASGTSPAADTNDYVTE